MVIDINKKLLKKVERDLGLKLRKNQSNAECLKETKKQFILYKALLKKEGHHENY